jgi:RNA polymerase sigma factor (sigma-70 family)
VSDQFRKIPTDKLLRRVAEARAAGDWTAARSEWEACIARARERVVFVVDKYVYVKRWIPQSDHEDTVQDALIRAGKALVENMDSLGEDAFFAAVVQVAKYQCMDDARKHMRREQHEKALDEPVSSDAAEQRGRHDDAITAQATSDWQRDLRAVEVREALNRALSKLSEKERVIVTAKHLGLTDEELAERFETSVNNVQQLRSRALRKLRENKELRGLIDP